MKRSQVELYLTLDYFILDKQLCIIASLMTVFIYDTVRVVEKVMHIFKYHSMKIVIDTNFVLHLNFKRLYTLHLPYRTRRAIEQN